MYELMRVSGIFPNIIIDDYGGFHTRNSSVEAFIQLMFKRFYRSFQGKRLDFFIYTGDQCERVSSLASQAPVFAFSTTKELRGKIIPIPDFVYTGWPEVGVESWEKAIPQYKKRASLPYEDSRSFWIGNIETHESREILLRLSSAYPHVLQARGITWPKSIPGSFYQPANYVSIPDHAKYKSLIDIRGVGYSARLKLLMHLGRPIFLVDRPYEEFFYPYMKPYKHYIPVKKDMSDLIEKIKWLHSDPHAYRKLAASTRQFADKYLSKSFALSYLHYVVIRFGTIAP